MTTPTPEAIEAVAAELCDWDNQYAWKSLGAESPMKASYEDAAERALTASAPFIATQTKAEALREAADAILTNDPLDYWSQHLPEGLGFQEAMSKWLLAHAATIESEAP